MPNLERVPNLNDKLSYIVKFLKRFWEGLCEIGRHMICPSGKKEIVPLALIVVLGTLELAILPLPSGALYLFGLLFSAGISFWCLRVLNKHGADNGGPNLKPALNVVYNLALFQGMLFGCWLLNTAMNLWRMKSVYHKFNDPRALKVVSK